MPRRFTVPAYQLHRGSGQAKVRIDGKDIYLGPHGSPESRERYEEIVRKLLSDRQRAELVRKAEISDQLTIAELVSAYLKHCRSYSVKAGRLTSEYHNIVSALVPLLDHHGFELVGSFGPRKPKAIRDGWVAAGIVRSQVNQRTLRVRRCFARGVGEELVPAEVLVTLRAVAGLREGRTSAVEGEGGRQVDIDHVERVLPLGDPRIATMIRLQLLSGMRPGEVVQMAMRAIDTTGPVWIFTPPRHKTAHHRKQRRVFLGPRAQETLRPWLRTELDAPLFQPGESRAERNAQRRANRVTKLWPSHVRHQARKRVLRPLRAPRDRYDVASYRQAIARTCHEADIPAWNPHGLRHTAASELRRQFGEETTRHVVGHSRFDTTRLHGEADQVRAAEAMGKIG
jgi:integrase